MSHNFGKILPSLRGARIVKYLSAFGIIAAIMLVDPIALTLFLLAFINSLNQPT